MKYEPKDNHEYIAWLERNCGGCRKYDPEEEFLVSCDMEKSYNAFVFFSEEFKPSRATMKKMFTNKFCNELDPIYEIEED
jgi:hypothetical protein